MSVSAHVEIGDFVEVKITGIVARINGGVVDVCDHVDASGSRKHTMAEVNLEHEAVHVDVLERSYKEFGPGTFITPNTGKYEHVYLVGGCSDGGTVILTNTKTGKTTYTTQQVINNRKYRKVYVQVTV